MMLRLWFLVGPVALVAGCLPVMDTDPRPPMPPQQTQGQCEAAPATWSVGLTATDEIVERAWDDSGARLLRVIRPDESVTMEYNSDRLNIELDRADVIRRVRCG
jgi:hypothetical protein